MKRIVAAFITIALMLSMTACMFGGKQWYTSSYTCYIQEKAGSSLSGESSTDEKLGETRLNTYANVLVSDNIINAVIDKNPSIGISPDELKDMLSVRVLDDSEIIEVSVTANDPETAYELASSHATVAPDNVRMIFEGSSMKIISYPKMPNTK